MFEFPPIFLDFLRYVWVADGEKAQRELGFKARYNSKEALKKFLAREKRHSIHLVTETAQ